MYHQISSCKKNIYLNQPLRFNFKNKNVLKLYKSYLQHKLVVNLIVNGYNSYKDPEYYLIKD